MSVDRGCCICIFYVQYYHACITGLYYVLWLLYIVITTVSFVTLFLCHERSSVYSPVYTSTLNQFQSGLGQLCKRP